MRFTWPMVLVSTMAEALAGNASVSEPSVSAPE